MVTPAEIRAVLSRWPVVVGGDAADTGGQPGFSGALVRRVVTSSGTFALRGWPTGESGLPRARIGELHRWLASLAATGIATAAVPLRSRDGSSLVEVHGRLWQLEPWLPGTADFHTQPTDARLRAAFTELARWHRAAERYAPSATGAQWFHCGRGVPPAVTERLERLRRLGRSVPTEVRLTGPSELTALAPIHRLRLHELIRRVAGELAEAQAMHLSLQVCLRDVWHDHLLFDGDAVTGIIDPSAARTENVASDLSRLLGSLLGDAFERWEVALDAYALVRPLSDDERRLARVLDRSGVILSALHWQERAARSPLNARERLRFNLVARRLESMGETIA